VSANSTTPAARRDVKRLRLAQGGPL